MRIIPAIDIIGGQCVRLTKGDYSTQKTYHENPLEVAKQFEANGIQYLHLVDLDGAKSNRIINYKALEEIAAKTSLKIDFGGGIKSNKDIEIAFECGANQVTGGSIAVKDPDLFTSWIQKYRADKLILGADVQQKKIAINGWQNDSGLDVIPFIKKYREVGIHTVICTDIAKDGMLQGSSVELYKELLEAFPDLNLIASGGVSHVNELYQLMEIGLEGAIVGKAIYEGKISLKELEQFIIKNTKIC